MAFSDIFNRKRRPLDEAEGEGVSPVGGELAGNEAVRRKQRMLLAGVAGVGLVLSSMWIFSGDEGEKTADADGAEKVEVSTKDMVNRNLSQQEWMALSENRFESTENQLKSVNGQQARMDNLAAQIEALKGQNSAMQADGQRVLSAYQAENDQLRKQLNERPATPPPVPGPAALYGQGGPQAYQRPGASGEAGAAPPIGRAAEVKMVSFSSAEAGTASKVAKGSTVYTDSPNYLPPNSFASAKVIVGVDASAGVNSQTDPLPVVLRVTGPARSVLQNGKLLTTKIQGCLINGAARGDLSSEKVYVKLQKMTCPQPGGRYAVSEVKGFIAFGGKTGVRGRVVSREGSLAMQAFLAGLVGGAGNALNTAFQQPLATISTDGEGGVNRTPSLGNVGLRALGGGAAESGRDVSKYLIERAEQYQPVIEMPTGVDVEIVFLEGVYVRN
ncbi:conjugal transfer protein TraB [Sphingomonas koreensis]|uniref:Conjugal transfer protein TraB n=1 Tax=Sphingomonas koreensis TaxID=93064 RepID=A0A1L6JIR5_9SPHN|nr:TrbI/VirB10 family protein [Sphingomonas koreensis]APR55380.1 conjugal transfer protein TraB [Sphingomonas koreensis]RSU17658.1 conjugal transfer protein TraB [Sphingomonas koreensis]RSU20127.1 conjugal transfer protein TraB [Sphingomonas koreensis]RSU22311.1 conjugal transfer protein TraB [Sphingomonas koreensis]RSU30403.1 conjugal transfer protein TraB [Sphingomonas koreensis]